MQPNRDWTTTEEYQLLKGLQTKTRTEMSQELNKTEGEILTRLKKIADGLSSCLTEIDIRSRTKLKATEWTPARYDGYVYVLWCENNTYYVGKTNNVPSRIAQHQNGTGAEWTRINKVIGLIFYAPIKDKYTEMNVTLQYMSLYGPDNVRGSAWSQINLDTMKQRHISDINRHNNGECVRCGSAQHYYPSCPLHNNGWIHSHVSTSSSQVTNAKTSSSQSSSQAQSSSQSSLQSNSQAQLISSSQSSLQSSSQAQSSSQVTNTKTSSSQAQSSSQIILPLSSSSRQRSSIIPTTETLLPLAISNTSSTLPISDQLDGYYNDFSKLLPRITEMMRVCRATSFCYYDMINNWNVKYNNFTMDNEGDPADLIKRATAIVESDPYKLMFNQIDAPINLNIWDRLFNTL